MPNPGPSVSTRNASYPSNSNATTTSRNPWVGSSYQPIINPNYYEPELSSHSSETGSRIYHVIDGPGPPSNYCIGEDIENASTSKNYNKSSVTVQNHHVLAAPHSQGTSTIQKLPPLDQLSRVPHSLASQDHLRSLQQPIPSRNIVLNGSHRRVRPTSRADYLEEFRPTQPSYYNVGSGRTSRATLDVPLSSITSDDDAGGIDACGGHCVAFENFCHYCLQVIFIAGILTGISLMIAGSILIGQKGNDDNHSDYIYIGCLMMLVCILLLSVQCCVRRNVKRRKRALRRTVSRRRPSSAHMYNDQIPLNDISPPSSTIREIYPLNGHDSGRSSLHQGSVHVNAHEKMNATVEPSASQSGIPWWRRQEMEELMIQHNFV